MNTQPEALRLADVLMRNVGSQLVNRKQASAELRRLYWEELRVREHRDQMLAEVTHLHALNAELLEALKLITEVGDRAATEIARAAMLKAREAA